MTNREKIFEDFGINLESSCICTSDEVAEECIYNGDCFGCEKWLNAEFIERGGNEMIISICDICKKKEADVELKYRCKEEQLWWPWYEGGWKKIDICQECLNKIIEAKEEVKG